MKKEIAELWVERLKVGRKARGRLRNRIGGMCCLGHLCELYRVQTGRGTWSSANWFATDDLYLPPSVVEWAGMKTDGFFGAEINDRSVGFSSVIEEIQKHWEEL